MVREMKYISGNLFEHVPNEDDEVVVIPHICNNIGAWGAGFVIPLGRIYPEAKQSYLDLQERELGDVLFVPIGGTFDKIVVANMIAQDGVGPKFDGDKLVPPIRYESLHECMKIVRDTVQLLRFNGKKVRIACPMFGAGLAGGNWDEISKMINSLWSKEGIEVNVYYLPESLPPGIYLDELK